MKTYTKLLIKNFFSSLFFVTAIIFSLVFILNLLSELEFFKDINVDSYFIISLSLLNSPDMIFQMFPFIFLITTQLFFIKLFENNEIEILKYSGLKNTNILITLSILSILTGIIIIMVFYNFSSNLKNYYLKLKSPYADDGKYLAVITNNGLWIKDEIDNKIIITNSIEVDNNLLINNFITEFNKDYEIIRNFKTNKIDILDKEWILYNAEIYQDNIAVEQKTIKLKTNFDYKRVSSLYSNLSSLTIFELYELRENYRKLNYSLTEINLQFSKLLTTPLLLFLITIFSSLIMFKVKRYDSSTFKIVMGLFFSVIIYYANNFFYVLASTEKLPLLISIFVPILTLTLINGLMLNNINEK
tara:strand:+ start:2479 stop:3552 length:1074 start_codon:yes stop_codon:yes gene_type:complete